MPLFLCPTVFDFLAASTRLARGYEWIARRRRLASGRRELGPRRWRRRSKFGNYSIIEKFSCTRGLFEFYITSKCQTYETDKQVYRFYAFSRMCMHDANIILFLVVNSDSRILGVGRRERRRRTHCGKHYFFYSRNFLHGHLLWPGICAKACGGGIVLYALQQRIKVVSYFSSHVMRGCRGRCTLTPPPSRLFIHPINTPWQVGTGTNSFLSCPLPTSGHLSHLPSVVK